MSPAGESPDTPDVPPNVRPAVYGRNYSYFSHRIFVAFMPEDLHKYLHERLGLVDASGAPVADSTQDPVAHSDAIDLDIVRWVLLHRSQLNALALNRELESWRGPDDLLLLPTDNGIRSDDAYRLDITLQIAVEMALADALGNGMLKNRPRLQLALLDAAYFISRQRAEQDRTRDVASDDQDIDIDLSESGRDAFEAYLVQRMNLDEDKVATAAGPGQPSRPDALTFAGRGPLSVMEVDWLHNVAIGVARTLSAESTTSADLQLRWNKAFAARWQARGLPLPDSTPFEAMLTGAYAPLIALPVSGAGVPQGAAPQAIESFRYRWRVSQFAGKPWAQSLLGIADNSEPVCQFIERVDALLRRAMFGPEVAAQPAAGPDQQPLRLLSDRYRVLPTTPAWAAVSEAITRMRQARKGVGNTAALARDARLLQQYADMLRTGETADAVGMMLIGGAALAGLQAGLRQPSLARTGRTARPHSADWTVAFSALHDGLQLSGIDVETAANRLVQMYTDLTTQMPQLPGRYGVRAAPSQPPGGIAWNVDELISAWPLPDELDNVVVGAFEAAWSIGQGRHIAPWMVDLAWVHLAERLHRLPFDRDGTWPANASELACAMLDVGPGPVLPLRLENAGARIWTDFLVNTLMERKANGDGPYPYMTPVTMVAHALERLGIRSLRKESQQAILRELSPSEAARDEIQAYVDAHPLWSGVGLSREVALVLGPALESMAEGWPMPPTGGLVLAVADINRHRLEAVGLDGLTRTGYMQIRIAFEPWVARQSETEQLEAWVRTLPQQQDFIRLWLYRSERVGTREPHLVDPESADELWNWGPSSDEPT